MYFLGRQKSLAFEIGIPFPFLLPYEIMHICITFFSKTKRKLREHNKFSLFVCPKTFSLVTQCPHLALRCPRQILENAHFLHD